VYRFWRDAGLVAGALVAGLAADALGSGVAIVIVSGLTATSGLVAASTGWIGAADGSHRQLALDR
jgi:hypothetical protein